MTEPKEYRYRAHIRWGQYLIPAFFILPILALWIIPLVSALTGQSSASFLLTLFLPLSLVLLAEAIALWLVFYRMAGTKLSIQAEGLSYTDRQGTMIIPFPEITKLEFPSLQYLGGWVKICSPQKTIRLTVVFEDIGDFLRD